LTATAVLLCGHGSRDREAIAEFELVAAGECYSQKNRVFERDLRLGNRRLKHLKCVAEFLAAGHVG